jgi:hypothetical protein
MLYALGPSPLLLYPFRFYDPVRRRWIRARYVAKIHDIIARHQQWEIIGPPEIRSGTPVVMLWASLAPRPAAHLPPVEEPPPDHGPTPDPPPVEQPPPIDDQVERFLVLLFLRRSVTWCARHRRFAAMNRAARLYREINAMSQMSTPSPLAQKHYPEST